MNISLIQPQVVTRTIRHNQIFALLRQSGYKHTFCPKYRIKNVSRYIFVKKHDVLECWSTEGLSSFLPASCKTEYRSITTNCCFTSDILNDLMKLCCSTTLVTGRFIAISHWKQPPYLQSLTYKNVWHKTFLPPAKKTFPVPQMYLSLQDPKRS